MIVNAPTLPSLPLRAGTQLITQASSVRVLGVMLDRKLSHAATVGLRIKSLHPIVQQIRYARQYLTTPELKKLYLEQAYPRILHSITIWGSENPSKGYLRPLIKIQKRLVRHIAKVGHRAPTRQLFTDLNILTVPYLYVHRLCTDMHSYITQKPSSARHAIAHIHHYQAAGAHHRYRTRATEKKNTLRITRDMDPLTKRYATIWNNVHELTRCIKDRKMFSFMLKLDLLHKQSTDNRIFTH